MSLWGSNTSAAASAPKFRPMSSHKANTVGSNTLYSNGTIGAHANGVLKTVSGTPKTTVPNGSHAGWYIQTKGTGPVLTASATVGGTGYANTDLLVITSQANSLNGGANATGTVSTNSTGGITGLSLSTFGKGFINATPTIAVTNATSGATAGSGATIVITVGGRAGRTHTESLVAAGSYSN